MLSVSQRVATSVPEHVRMVLEVEFCLGTDRSTIRANPSVVKGDPRSDVKTNGDLATALQAP